MKRHFGDHSEGGDAFDIYGCRDTTWTFYSAHDSFQSKEFSGPQSVNSVEAEKP